MLPRFLELASWYNNVYVYVNAHAICAIRKDKDGSTALHMQSGLDIHVKESMTDVVQMIANLTEDA